jgi:DNA-binding LacI/PurR family transcriptional regulator
MKGIARMAGVSEATVSRALSGSPLVAETTRARIMEIARASRYAVNEQARNLARGSTRTVEVLFPIDPGTLQQVSDPFFVDMLASLTDALAAHGYDALLTKSPPWDPERPGCAFLGGRANGVIFVGQGRHRAEIRDFARAHGRVVAWGALRQDEDTCVVGSDNAGGARAATEHLLRLGRRRLVFLGDTTLPEIAQRHEGYAAALQQAGLAPEATLPAPFDVEGARAAARPLAAMAGKVDGIVAASDMIALAAIDILREAGLSVPGDVSVVGFDDVAVAAHVHPALTTVHQRIRHGGKRLVEKMIGLIEGEPQEPEMLPTTLIVRESCGAKG